MHRIWEGLHPIRGGLRPRVLLDPLSCRLPVGVSNGEAGGDPRVGAQTWKRKSSRRGGLQCWGGKK